MPMCFTATGNLRPYTNHSAKGDMKMKVTIDGHPHDATRIASEDTGSTAWDTYEVANVGRFSGYRDRMGQWARDGSAIGEIEGGGALVYLSEDEAPPAPYGDGMGGFLAAFGAILSEQSGES